MLDMTDHYSSLGETLSRLSAAPVPSSIWSTLKEYSSRFGYSYLMAVEAGTFNKLGEAIIYSDAPSEMISAFDQNLEFEQHPYAVKSKRSSAPFTMSEVKSDPEFANQDWAQYLSDVVKAGEGLFVPVYLESRLVSGFSFGGHAPETSGLARSALQVASHAAFERANDLREGRAIPLFPSLSVRETQCLRYIATGYEDDQISQMLGISPRTVRFHVDSAKSKLGVGSRVQAVAKALRERIIAV